jgi:uncharacterized membrane protein
MKMLERSVTIAAPAEKVFSYVEQPQNLPEVWPSLVEVTDVADLPKGGHRFHWLYKMAGLRFEGETETVEYELNKHVVTKSTGQIPSTYDWTFVPENGSTRLDVKVEYEIPQTLLGKLAEPFIVKLNEREADAFIGNLKDRIEA